MHLRLVKGVVNCSKVWRRLAVSIEKRGEGAYNFKVYNKRRKLINLLFHRSIFCLFIHLHTAIYSTLILVIYMYQYIIYNVKSMMDLQRYIAHSWSSLREPLPHWSTTYKCLIERKEGTSYYYEPCAGN